MRVRNEGQGFESRKGIKVTRGALKTLSRSQAQQLVTCYADVKQIVYLCSSHSLNGSYVRLKASHRLGYLLGHQKSIQWNKSSASSKSAFMV